MAAVFLWWLLSGCPEVAHVIQINVCQQAAAPNDIVLSLQTAGATKLNQRNYVVTALCERDSPPDFISIKLFL